jgi:hypothetical protein
MAIAGMMSPNTNSIGGSEHSANSELQVKVVGMGCQRDVNMPHRFQESSDVSSKAQTMGDNFEAVCFSYSKTAIPITCLIS